MFKQKAPERERERERERVAKLSNSSRVLIIILSSLIVLIVLLIVGIVVLKNSEEETKITYSSEQEKAYYNYVDEYNKVRTEAQELLNGNPTDVNSIIDLYQKAIDKYTIADNYTSLIQAVSFIDARTEDLLSKNLDRAALDALTKTDFSIFNKPEQYRQYNTIIEIAQKLGDSKTAAKYKDMAAMVKEAYMASCRGSAEKAKEYGVQTEVNPLCEDIGDNK